MTSPLPNPICGHLCPEPKSPALRWLSTALQPLLDLAQPLVGQKILATSSATSSFCNDLWPLLVGQPALRGLLLDRQALLEH